MSAAPWYQERSAYLMNNSRAGTVARRRAEVLARAARRSERAGAGISATAVQDELTPELWRRVMGREGRGLAAKTGLLLLAAFAAVVIGPGVALGRYGIYRAAVDLLSPRVGRLVWWPWAVAAGALAVLRWVLTDWPRLGVALGVGRYFPGDFVMLGGWAAWAQWQAVVALATTAYAIRAWWWAGVPRGAVAPPEKKKDGTWNTVVDADKARQIDPYAGEPDPPAHRPVAEPEPTQAPDEPRGDEDARPVDADDLSDLDFTPGEFGLDHYEGIPDDDR